MRVVIEFNRGGDENKSELANDLAQPILPVQRSNQWLYSIFTCGIALAIAVRPMSDSIKMMRPVVWLQLQVGTVVRANVGVANSLYEVLRRKGYPIATGKDKVNAIYVRGGDINGKPTGNRINEWSDVRFVLMFRSGVPYIAGAWKATIKPGLPAIRNPLGKSGAAFIEDGYYSAWRLGIHRGIFGRTERGLVQVAPTKFRRDVNRDGSVRGEPLQTGMIGLNQHAGSNSKNVDSSSYACLVGQSSNGHLKQFIPLIENDPRYRADPQYTFGTAILSVNDLQ